MAVGVDAHDGVGFRNDCTGGVAARNHRRNDIGQVAADNAPSACRSLRDCSIASSAARPMRSGA